MIYKGKAILSSKLAKQLKALERKPGAVLLGQILDEVSDRVNGKKKNPRRRA